MRVGLVGTDRIGILHADALEALYVAEAAVLSRARGRPVRLDEVR